MRPSGRGGGAPYLLYWSFVPTDSERRRLGAWYTPPSLVAAVTNAALDQGRPLRIIDPACGDGRFLAAVRDELRRRSGIGSGALELVGVDLDPVALDLARRHLGDGARLVHADALEFDPGDANFDLVIGNPPFLSPLHRRNRSRYGASGRYADAAVEFWNRAHDLARPDGGVVALVLPQSVLASRDSRVVRQRILERAGLHWCWWSPVSMFPDAQVITCALVTVNGVPASMVNRVTGPDFEPLAPRDATVLAPVSWSGLITDTLGVPDLVADRLDVRGCIADHAVVRGDFRDQYYGLIGSITEEGAGPGLVTSGLIDPGRCHWGERRVRFGGQAFDAPRVRRSTLTPTMRAWVRRRLVPKVLVASQTRVIEAVADPTGRWVPSVPVVSVIPSSQSSQVMPTTSRLAAVLTSPVASAWVAHRSAGSGRAGSALRISASTLASIPCPSGSLDPAVTALEAGDVASCAQEATAAYGLGTATTRELMEWWSSALPGRRG